MASTVAKREGKLSQIFKRSRQSYCELPKTDKKAGELKKEIEEQHPENSKNSLTVSYYERHSLLANAIMPISTVRVSKKNGQFLRETT